MQERERFRVEQEAYGAVGPYGVRLPGSFFSCGSACELVQELEAAFQSEPGHRTLHVILQPCLYFQAKRQAFRTPLIT